MRRHPDEAHGSLVLRTTTAATVREPAVVERLDHSGVRVLCQPFLIGELLEMVAATLSGVRLTS